MRRSDAGDHLYYGDPILFGQDGKLCLVVTSFMNSIVMVWSIHLTSIKAPSPYLIYMQINI